MITKHKDRKVKLDNKGNVIDEKFIYKFKLFGVRVFKDTFIYKADISDDSTNNKVGFTK